MFARLGKFVSQHWLLVILCWIAATAALKAVAPSWSDVTCDGNFAYLPESMTSVAGERLTAQAFPESLAKSQIVLLAVRDHGKLSRDDLYVASDIARRFRNIFGAVEFARGKRLAQDARDLRLHGAAREAQAAAKRSDAAMVSALEAFDEAISLDEELAEYQQKRAAKGAGSEPGHRWGRLAAAYYNRALLNHCCGRGDESRDRERALALDSRLADRGDRTAPDGAADWPLLDVWTWHDEVFGPKLMHDQTRLAILQLSNEFIDTDNIRLVEKVEAELEQVRRALDPRLSQGLTVGFTGSAAVGGDLFRAAKETIRRTEVFTVVMVVFILAVVYRSPLLVAVPLATISIALAAATGFTALLTELNVVPGFGWWDLKVFTTTRVFVVVILFGAGTDFCLFLISRYREYLALGMESGEAVAASLGAVGEALAASALTTICGFSMMIFADFGKFRHSGPVIGLCLAVTLAACLTLAPALLRACQVAAHALRLPQPWRWSARREGRRSFFWPWAARIIVARPGLILAASVLLLLPLGAYGLGSSQRVTFDFLSALGEHSPSKEGAELLRRHFPVGEAGPLTLLVELKGGQFDTLEGTERIRQLAYQLYVEGVTAVRHVTDPLGQFRPGQSVGIFRRGLKSRLMRAHTRVEKLFVSKSPSLAGNVTRLELVLQYDPFSPEAGEVLDRVERKIRQLGGAPGSDWGDARFLYTGVTAAIRDLKAVTQSDNVVIQRLVVLAVLGVLLVILRRPVICVYLVLSVLFSYYVTIGATELFFQWAYGGAFQGLDWRTPTFLFVILVAVGQDYNVYLVTRVIEEQSRYGLFAGLRRAVVCTGGIITSCGVIMAGTFFSMTSGEWGRFAPAWMPLSGSLLSAGGGTLPGIVELGFALTLGIMLDTFVVRPVLVPAFWALLCRWQVRKDPIAAAARWSEDRAAAPVPLAASASSRPQAAGGGK